MPYKNTIIGIIGGKGLLGNYFANFFRSLDLQVLISDLDTPLSNRELVKRSNIIVFSVPIRHTVEVIRSVIDLVREDQALVDLTSLKLQPVSAMLESKGEVLGLHPMFGPPIKSLSGQTVIVCKARPRLYTEWFLSLLLAKQIRLKDSTPEEHDKMMSVVQGLNHLSSIAFASTLQALQIDITESIAFSSPVYRIRMDLVARLLAQDSELYADIALQNPAIINVINELINSLQKIKQNISTSNRVGFLEQFKEASEHLGEFRGKGLEESEGLIHYLATLPSFS